MPAELKEPLSTLIRYRNIVDSIIQLDSKTTLFIIPKPPFNFKGTVYNPSHFPTPTEIYENGIKLIQEVKYRFELDLDLSEFNKKFKKDKILGPVIKRRLGMRSKCGYSLYESLMIYIVLQNATVRRTVQMMNSLLEKYGEKVNFGDKDLYIM